MASLSKEAPKRWRIQFMDVAGTGRRKQIRLYNVTKRQADETFRHIEATISARLQGVRLDDVDAAWLGSRPENFYRKLVKAGLASPRETEVSPRQSPELERFLDDFIQAGLTLKGNPASLQTLKKWEGTKALLVECFGPAKLVCSFSVADATAFRRWMESRSIPKTPRNRSGRMAENSMRQRIANCKTFFSHAVREELIADNPFRNQPSTTQENDNGKQNIAPEIIEQVIDAAPDDQWKALIALWRFAGLRKMEPLQLTWGDVLWDEGKLRVWSTKTSNHAGRSMRYVPLRDVRPYLEAAKPEGAKPEDRIISRYRPSMSNLHSPFKKIIEDAGVTPWPNLMKNLRLSCENDWLDRGEAPTHVIAAWIGHDVEVQKSHYAIVSDGHFDQFNERPVSHHVKMAHIVPQNSSERGGTDKKTLSHQASQSEAKALKAVKSLVNRLSKIALERTRTSTG
ncbi:MAG: hypothetical protein Fues2KO_24120 [Fuerstiella sp.]